MSKYLGIDPGAEGGLAVIDCTNAPNIEVMTQELSKLELPELWGWFAWEANDGNCKACLELVSGYAGEPHPGSRMFEFGEGYGALQGFLIAAAIPYKLVTPQKWQRAMNIPFRNRRAGELKYAHKTRLLYAAKKLFPRHHITRATCDALLIAEYCRRELYAKANET